MTHLKTTAPTLGENAISGFLDLANCGSASKTERPAYRAIRAKPGGRALWIYRIEGLDLCSGYGSVPLVVYMGRHGLTEEHYAEECPDYGFDGYSPSATYEGGRMFWTGTPAACRALMDAIEYEASQSAELAHALENDDSDDGGIEAVLFEWPQGDAASLTLCNVSIYQDRREAFEKLLANVAKNHPGILEAMESLCENTYAWNIHQVWDDDVSTDGGNVAPRVLLAIYDQDESIRQAFEMSRAEFPDDHLFQAMERALSRREIEQATGAPALSKAGPILRV